MKPMKGERRFPSHGFFSGLIVTGEAEALDIAHRLAADFIQGAAERDRTRSLPFAEVAAFSQSGIMVSKYLSEWK